MCIAGILYYQDNEYKVGHYKTFESIRHKIWGKKYLFSASVYSNQNMKKNPSAFPCVMSASPLVLLSN